MSTHFAPKMVQDCDLENLVKSAARVVVVVEISPKTFVNCRISKRALISTLKQIKREQSLGRDEIVAEMRKSGELRIGFRPSRHEDRIQLEQRMRDDKSEEIAQSYKGFDLITKRFNLSTGD